MELIYEKRYTLGNPECDLNLQWRPGAMLLEMQNSGEEHSIKLGVGYQTLIKQNLAWVITRSTVEVDRYPRRDEIINIATWPGKVRHALFPRYYVFSDLAGNTLCKASTLWVVMDLEKRTMISPRQCGLVDFEVPDIPGCLPLPGNVRALDASPTVYNRTPTYTDIDVNGHMNNTRYIDWLCDAYEPDWHRQHQISKLTVHYNSELLPGSNVRVELRRVRNEFQMLGIEGETAHFAMSGEWVARDANPTAQ